jgi:hypothetical protein
MSGDIGGDVLALGHRVVDHGAGDGHALGDQGEGVLMHWARRALLAVQRSKSARERATMAAGHRIGHRAGQGIGSGQSGVCGASAGQAARRL